MSRVILTRISEEMHVQFFWNDFQKKDHVVDRVMFTDESAILFKQENEKRVFLVQKEPAFYEEIEKCPPHVIMWAALSAESVVGPFLF